MAGRHARSDRELLSELDFEAESRCEVHGSQTMPCGRVARYIVSCQDCNQAVPMAEECYRLFQGLEHKYHAPTHRLRVTDLRHL